MAGRELERLYAAIHVAADLAGVRCDLAATRAIFEAYEARFTRAAVSLRTSTRPAEGRELHVRYVELDRVWDPYPTALARGFVRAGDHPVDRLLPEIQRALPLLGYGVDVDVGWGLEKIWPFFPQAPQPLARLYALPSLPPAVRANERVLLRHGFDDVSLFALDYRNRTANLYFMRPPGRFSPAELGALVEDCGLPRPSFDVLRLCAGAVPIYFTFSWASPRIERLCFGMIAPEPALVPAHLDPLIARFVAGAPFATERRIYIYSVTVGRAGLFYKIENDYSGSMADLMRPPVAPPTAELRP